MALNCPGLPICTIPYYTDVNKYRVEKRHPRITRKVMCTSCQFSRQDHDMSPNKHVTHTRPEHGLHSDSRAARVSEQPHADIDLSEGASGSQYFC